MSMVLAWKLLARFWPLLPLAAGLAFLVFLTHRIDLLTDQRDKAQATALQYQQSASEWEASFRQSEKMRQSEQERAVQGINASEASCDARVKAARSSAVKIEHIVNKQPMECKPGEAIPRVLADPAELLGAIGVR